ncbi:MAG: Tfp pilus assembly protein FimT/FimU [Candidatus Paceibacteria bacterium]
MNKGFSLTETIIIVAVSIILLTIVTGAFSGFNKNQSLNSTVSEVTSVLNEARALTLASLDNESYGVHFESDKVILFKGSVFSSSDPDNNTTIISSKISISDISLTGGGDDIIFQRLTGKTSQNGTITLSLISDPSKSKTITIEVSGIIEL